MVDYNEKAESFWHRKVAVMFIGNKGAGKSTLLNQLGGSFKSGFSLIDGVTTDVNEQEVLINGQRIILMDTPGLYEVVDQETELNSKKLTEALRRGYHYKLFFVVGSNSRGISSEDLALLTRVNEAVSDAKGAKIDFWVIVNQIRGEGEYRNYERFMTAGNFQKYLNRLTTEIKTLSFDIQIKDVLLLRYDENAIRDKELYPDLSSRVMDQEPVQLYVKRIKTNPRDNTSIKEGMDQISLGTAFIGGVALGGMAVVAGAAIVINPASAPVVVQTVGSLGMFLAKHFIERYPANK